MKKYSPALVLFFSSLVFGGGPGDRVNEDSRKSPSPETAQIEEAEHLFIEIDGHPEFASKDNVEWTGPKPWVVNKLENRRRRVRRTPNQRARKDIPLHAFFRELKNDFGNTFSHIEALQHLLQGWTLINAEDPEGQTPLHLWMEIFHPAQEGHAEILDLMLAHGANPSHRNLISNLTPWEVFILRSWDNDQEITSKMVQDLENQFKSIPKKN